MCVFMMQPCVIVDIMTLKRVIVEGPEVKRQVMTLRRLQLTDFCLELSRGASSKDVKAALKEDNLVEKFYASAWGKKRQAFHKKRELTDFERFKVSRARSIISKKVAAA